MKTNELIYQLMHSLKASIRNAEIKSVTLDRYNIPEVIELSVDSVNITILAIYNPYERKMIYWVEEVANDMYSLEPTEFSMSDNFRRLSCFLGDETSSILTDKIKEYIKSNKTNKNSEIKQFIIAFISVIRLIVFFPLIALFVLFMPIMVLLGVKRPVEAFETLIDSVIMNYYK